MLADLRREAGIETIRLGGLRPSETAALVAAHLGRGSVDSALAQRLFDQTGGNPFFIEELLHTPAAARAAPVAVPEGVKDVIGRRLDRLPPATLETLTLAAVLGSDFRLATLQAVAVEQPQDELIASLEAAVAARLIVEDPDEVDRFSFTHALVRQTLYERPIASRRLRLHRRVAVALEAAPLPVHPAELAHHYFQAREVGGAAKAIVYSLKAAEASQAAHAYEDAAAHYERALVALEHRQPRRRRRALRRAAGARRGSLASERARPALDVRGGRRARPRARRHPTGWRGRCWARADASTPRAPPTRPTSSCSRRRSTALEPGDSVLRVRLLARLAEKLVFAQPPERAGELAAEAVAMARRLGEAGALAAALMGRHAALLHAEHAQERRRVGEQALALAGELGALELAALARHWLLYDLAELGELEEARRRHAELELVADELQQPLYRHSSLAWRCVWAALAGPLRRGRADRARVASAWPSTPEHPTRRRTSPPSWSPCGASRAACTSCCRRSSASPAPSPPRPPGAASCRSPISTPATAARAQAAYDSALGGGVRDDPPDHALADRHGLAGRGGRRSSATPTAARSCTPSSSPTQTASCSGASPATPAPCTACSAAPRPSPAGATARAPTSRPPSSGTPRWAPRRCWPARAATTASSCCTAHAPSATRAPAPARGRRRRSPPGDGRHRRPRGHRR